MLRAIPLVVTGPAPAFALPATEVHQPSTEGHHRHSTHLRTLEESSALVGGCFGVGDVHGPLSPDLG